MTSKDARLSTVSGRGGDPGERAGRSLRAPGARLTATKRFQRDRRQKLSQFSPRPAVRRGKQGMESRAQRIESKAQRNENIAQGNESQAQGNENIESNIINSLAWILASGARLPRPTAWVGAAGFVGQAACVRRRISLSNSSRNCSASAYGSQFAICGKTI